VHVRTWVRWLPKRGNAPEEYEDAYRCDHSRKSDILHFAVADGATEASFSQQWAQLLVRSYSRGHLTESTLPRILPILLKDWQEKVHAKPLSWYAEAKLQEGAYSSLVGLTLYDDKLNGTRRWEALGVGDSCLFQIQKKELTTKWPIVDSSQFTYHPILISTKLDDNENLGQINIHGDWKSGDVFYLMTDAIAQYFLASIEKGSSPESVIPELSEKRFSEWVFDLRNTEQMRNDDVTVLRIDVL
jgi:hypothetical protein